MFWLPRILSSDALFHSDHLYYLSTNMITQLSSYQPIPRDSSQGLVWFYQDQYCADKLTEVPTPLNPGSCLNIPFPNTTTFLVQSMPTCADGGSPIIVVFQNADCMAWSSSHPFPSTTYGHADACQVFWAGQSIGSVEMECFGSPDLSSGSWRFRISRITSVIVMLCAVGLGFM